jgi:hypothetical protein
MNQFHVPEPRILALRAPITAQYDDASPVIGNPSRNHFVRASCHFLKNKRMKSIDDGGVTEKNTNGPHLYCSLCIRPTPLPRIIAYVTHEL